LKRSSAKKQAKYALQIFGADGEGVDHPYPADLFGFSVSEMIILCSACKLSSFIRSSISATSLNSCMNFLEICITSDPKAL